MVEEAAAAVAHAAGRHILCHSQQAAAEVEEAVAEASKSRLLRLLSVVAVVAEVGAAVDPRRWGSSWLRLTVGNE